MALNKVTYRFALDLLKPGPQFKIYVSTGEAAARQFIISLRRGSAVYEIAEGVSAKFYAEKPDGTILYNDCTIDGNKIVYDVTTQTVAAAGDVKAQLQIFDAGGAVLYSPEFILSVSSILFDESAAESTDEYGALVVLLGTMQTLESDIESAESGRVAAESARVTAEDDRDDAESARATAEAARVIAETDRSSAESARETSEIARIASEAGRASAETTRESNESDRQSSESDRESAEIARASSETSRASAEATRGTNESTRQTNESSRQTNETARGNAETDRTTAESARAAAELARAAAESARTAAEAARVAAESARAAAAAARAFIAEYDSGTSYVVGNEVGYNGSTYRCIADCSGVTPTDTDYWFLVARAGVDGEGSGDMLSDTYDSNHDGKVNSADDADKLGGEAPAYYAPAANIPTTLAELSDDSTHRLVTDTEKGTWSGKQDALGFTPPDVSKMFYPGNQYGGIETTNLNTLSVSGFYTCYGTATGAPTSDSSWFVIHINSNVGTSYAYQIAKAYSQYALYYRIKSSDTWGVWSQLRASEVVITDAGGYFSSGPSVETVMQEIGSELDKLKPHVVNLGSYAPALGYLEFNEEIRCINPDLTAPPSCIIGDFGDPVTVLTFHPVIVYKSPGTTAPTITNESGQSLTWQGIDVLNNVFYPKAGRIYRLAFEYISFSITITVSASDESLCEVPTQTSITLSSSSWSSSTYTISNAAITSATVAGDIKIAQSATAAQYAAWGAAQPQVTAQSTGSLTITARGDVPTIDIPVVLEVRA